MQEKQKKDTKIAYITTKEEVEKAIFRLSNFFILFALVMADSQLNIDFPESAYIIVIGAMLGVDIPALTRKFLKRM